jgi:hypothetical protein
MFVNNISAMGHSQSVSRTFQNRVSLPPYMLSRTEPKMSDEEFEQRIREMAKRDHAAGRFQSTDSNSDFHVLERSFVSVVSPDREGMINNALPAIMRSIKAHERMSNIPAYNSYEEMIMHLLFGIEPPPSSNFNEGSILLFELKDEDGNVLARLFTSGWERVTTPAENARSAEFIAIYNEAWRSARFAQKAEKHGWGTPIRECGWGESQIRPSIPVLPEEELAQMEPNHHQRYKDGLFYGVYVK